MAKYRKKGEKITLVDRMFIKRLKRIWGLYSVDPKELYRKDIPNEEPLFTADRFLNWLINFEYYEKLSEEKL